MFGNVAGNLLVKSKQAIIIPKILQPLNTFKRLIVLLTPNAELENGFARSALKINTLLKQLGSNVLVYGFESTLKDFSAIVGDKKQAFYKYYPISTFEDFEPLDSVKEDDFFIFLSARKQTLSYDFHVEDMPKRLHKLNEFTSFLIIYPEISKTLQDSASIEMTSVNIEQNYEKVKNFTGKITGIFKKENEGEA